MLASLRTVCCGVSVALLLSAHCPADDWPQWMGPGRDNVWRESGLLERFPEGGPKVLWRVPVAGGYAGPAVAGGRVFVTDYVTGDDVLVSNFERKPAEGVERVLCLDEATGEVLWKHEYPVQYTISYPSGPRCTPVVEEDRVYTLGSEGQLICLDAASGDVLWQKNFPEEYGAKTSLWGYCSHPLVDGDKLLCVAGGEGSHTVALDKLNGEELWRSGTSSDQGYSPPTIIEAAGVRQLIVLRPDAVAALNPESGEELWSVPYEATSGSIIMSPIQVGEYLYVGGYNNKNLLLKLAADRPAAEVVWGNKSKHGISPVNVQPMLHDGQIVGVDQSGLLLGFELPSGERVWQTPQPVSERRVSSGTAFLVRQDDRFWMFTENGELVIAKINAEGFEELDRSKLIDATNNAFGRDVVWCMPAFANQKMFVRNDAECICVDLSAE